LVIFDCDGVLVDSEPLLINVRLEMLGELGIAMDRREVVDRFVGTPHSVFAEAIEERLGRPLPPTWAVEYQARCQRAFEQHLAPVAGVVDALDHLDVPTCVASSGSHAKMTMTLGLTGLLPRFAGRIFSGDDVAHGKPAPDLFLFAASSLNTAPESCVVVEDSAAGVTAGLAAGMRVVAYGSGVTPREQLERPGVIVIDEMALLPQAIAG